MSRRLQPPIWYRADAYSPMPRRLPGVHSWRWEIRDGDANGPVLADGTTLTRWGANRQRERARARCRRRTRPTRTLTPAEREAGLALINRLMPTVVDGWRHADDGYLAHEAERLESMPGSPVIKSMRLILAEIRAGRAEAVSAR